MLDDYTPPVSADVDENSKPRELLNRTLVVQALEIRDGIVTRESPDGTTAIRLNVADITAGKAYVDALWFGGGLVDNLKPAIGKTVAIRLELVKSAAGRTYPKVLAASDEDKKAAGAWLQSNPTAFAKVDVWETPAGDEPPF